MNKRAHSEDAPTEHQQPASVHDVMTPCLLVDMDVVQRNATKMLNTCKGLGVKLRCNMKTHKSREIGRIQTAGSRRCISVSTLKEAEYFADGGFDDILYTSMLTSDKIGRAMALLKKLNSFHVMLDNEAHLQVLEQHPLPDHQRWSAFLKVDTGGMRAGVLWNADHGIQLADKISRSKFVTFNGLYTHEGHSYISRGYDAIVRCGHEAVQRILHLAQMIKSAGLQCPEITVGSTPSCNCPSENMSQLTELHPGNYIFNDVQQTIIGSCAQSEIAVRVATRVKGHCLNRNQLLIDAGFLAMSWDGFSAFDGALGGSFCRVDGHDNLKLVKMSQEVGHIEPRSGSLDFASHPIGSLLFLLPYHACATACQFTEFYGHSGDQITNVMIPCKGW